MINRIRDTTSQVRFYLEETEHRRDLIQAKYRFIKGMGISVIICSVIYVTVLSLQSSNYENGLAFLHDNKYSEAILEFQKVEINDKDYNNTLPKKNYIYGIESFQDGFYSQAKEYFEEVYDSDEYYSEAQLMIDKIDSSGGKRITEFTGEKVMNETNETIDTVRQNLKTSETSNERNNVKEAVNNISNE